MIRVSVRCLTLGSLLFAAATGPTQALQIDLLNAQFTTIIGRAPCISDASSPYGFSQEWQLRTNVSSGPVSDFFPGGTSEEALADADLFHIRTSASAAFGNYSPGKSSALARTEFTFAPEMSVLTPIQIHLSTAGQFFYGTGHVGLTDLTTGTLLWSYDYQGTSGTLNLQGNTSSLDWTPSAINPGVCEALLSLDTDLNSSHTYQFAMLNSGNSNFPDSDSRLTEVSGLEVFAAVPEPSALALTALAGTILLSGRNKRCKN